MNVTVCGPVQYSTEVSSACIVLLTCQISVIQYYVCLHEWGISSNRVLMIISDIGANMVKAVRLLNECHRDEQRAEESEEGNLNTDDDEESENEENQAVEMIELADITGGRIVQKAHVYGTLSAASDQESLYTL